MKYSEEDIDIFIAQSSYKSYSEIAKKILKTSKNALIKQTGWDEAEYLYYNIKTCVQSYSRDKDQAIYMFKDFVDFLQRNRGIIIKTPVKFPPIPISNSFERLMFISKYMQVEGHTREDVSDILWVSRTTVDNDFSRLLNPDNPEAIQVLGRPFVISGAKSSGGKVHFESTAHPIFLTPNLTQVLLILEGLKEKAQNPILETESISAASDIWNQLSYYAKSRIKYVLTESLLISDLDWYESLENKEPSNSFHIEKKHPRDRGFVFDCVKNNRRTFCVEFNEEGTRRIYKDCVGEKIIDGKDIIVKVGKKSHLLHIKDIVRISNTIEELMSEESNLVLKD